MKKIFSVIILLQICICIGGCKTSFIDNSQNVEFNLNDYFDENGSKEAVNSSVSMNDIYLANEDNTLIQDRAEEYTLYDGVNYLCIQLHMSINHTALGWEENIPVNLYVINNGKIVPFAIGDSKEYNLYNKVDYVIEEKKEVIIKLKNEDITSDSGLLHIMAYFNPEAEAGRELQSYSGGIIHSIGYTNEHYAVTVDESVPEYTGEYMEIPLTYVRNAIAGDIGDDNLYTSEYKKKLYEGDVVVADSSDDLYIYWNEGPGQELSDSLMIGLLVDGELCKISGEDYFIKIQQNNGRQTFKYSLSFLGELEPGVHSIAIVSLYDDAFMSIVSNRQAVVIQ